MRQKRPMNKERQNRRETEMIHRSQEKQKATEGTTAGATERVTDADIGRTRHMRQRGEERDIQR